MVIKFKGKYYLGTGKAMKFSKGRLHKTKFNEYFNDCNHRYCDLTGVINVIGIEGEPLKEIFIKRHGYTQLI